VLAPGTVYSGWVTAAAVFATLADLGGLSDLHPAVRTGRAGLSHRRVWRAPEVRPLRRFAFTEYFVGRAPQTGLAERLMAVGDWKYRVSYDGRTALYTLSEQGIERSTYLEAWRRGKTHGEHLAPWREALSAGQGALAPVSDAFSAYSQFDPRWDDLARVSKGLTDDVTDVAK